MKIYIKREDLLHPYVSGNKFRKLKYNLLEAKKQGYSTILTFGGAFSNHISAVSYAAQEFGFQSIGVIRGEELHDKISENATLSFAQANGMQFEFVSRDDYRQKDSKNYIEKLRQQFGDFYLVPEGGTNKLAVKGCEEILTEEDDFFDYICCAVGTGGTISGIINSSKTHQKVLGFPALKGDFLDSEIKKFTQKENWELITDYHFGGYAKINETLISFINKFRDKTHIPLDPVYTGKMCYGVFDLIRKGYFEKDANILLIHTGGLQGIAGMNEKLKKQNLTLIHV
jgi:1-aminocyclopropane-1-carboxylate deaminase